MFGFQTQRNKGTQNIAQQLTLSQAPNKYRLHSYHIGKVFQEGVVGDHFDEFFKVQPIVMVLIEALVIVDDDRRQRCRTWHLLSGFDESRQFFQTDEAIVISIALKKKTHLKTPPVCQSVAD
ncbi:hypothetical protein D910_05268 [Dendroctonus ponderosae]|uniref:Uncharacterized protein n=1 Tax=Dendroctonus ponderosae TaxID=77166 RepID=U4UD88_DENPD|nr:hypothetical protein D910_05268 [Dendroctonus ponderosae]